MVVNKLVEKKEDRNYRANSGRYFKRRPTTSVEEEVKMVGNSNVTRSI